MPTYIYKARDVRGKSVRGTMEAKSKEDVADRLHRMGYMTTEVVEALPGFKIKSVMDKLRPVGADEMLLLYFQLSNMISAGIPILKCLDVINRDMPHKKLKECVGNVYRTVEGGESFSQALSRRCGLFPKLFVNMVRAGEASGKLDTVLARYAEYFEHQVELGQKIKGALFYPMILLFAGIAVTLFIVTYIVPQFAVIFQKAGLLLPLPTMILLSAGMAIRDFWLTGVLFLVALWIAFMYYTNTGNGRLNLDRIKLRLPLLGPIYRKVAISRFARTLATLVASGVPILESLEITEEVVGNESLSQVISQARVSIEKGEKLSGPLQASEEFPPDAIQMIMVGEETGNMDGMLGKIADFYDMSVGYAIKKLTTVIEPLFLVIMGCMVGFIMISMLLPIFDMIKILRR